MIEFEFDYRSRHAVGELGRAVERIWCARGTVPYRSELISPTGSTVILLILGDVIRETTAAGAVTDSDRGLLIGPHTAPVVNAPLGETFVVGIVTTCTGTAAVTSLQPRPLRGRVVELSATASPLVELREELVSHRTDDPEALLDATHQHVQRELELEVPGLERIERAVTALETDPRRPIADIAHELGVTHTHLDREFCRIVGLTPRALARLLLLRRVLSDLEPDGNPSWSRLAADYGWADQAHFSRDFRRHTGVSPARYLRTQRAFGAGRSEGVAFTPDLDSLR